jgi:hypothetical protein
LLKDLRPSTIINKCRRNFRTHGIPEMVLCDNGTQFNSQEFLQFARHFEFKVSFCSPYHKEGNGKAEATIEDAKNLIKKCAQNKEDLDLALLVHRNTPKSIGLSPVQRLYSRRTRCSVPFAKEMLMPQVQNDVKEKIAHRRAKSKFYHDRKAKPLSELRIGEPVFVKLKGMEDDWRKGTVERQVKSRSYEVQVGGRNYRRNRLHMRSANETEPDPDTEQTPQPQSSVSMSPVANTPQIITSSPRSPKSASNETMFEDALSDIEQEAEVEPATPIRNQTTYDGRPRRNRNVPVKFKDYVMIQENDDGQSYLSYRPLQEEF